MGGCGFGGGVSFTSTGMLKNVGFTCEDLHSVVD